MTLLYSFTFATDIPTLQALSRKIWCDCYPGIITHDQIEYMLERMYGTAVIAKELAAGVLWELVLLDGKAIGYAAYEFDANAREVHLHKLYLLKEHHGKGFGQQMLDHVKAQARALRAQAITLRVNRNNAQAVKAYQRSGFVIAKTDVADIGGGFIMDDYIMRCDL